MIWVKSPHKQFSPVTYVWSWDFIGIFLQGQAIKEVCQGHPGGTRQNIMEAQNLSQTVTQSAVILAGSMAFGLHASDHALSRFCVHFILLESPVVVYSNKKIYIRVI